jgi:hypothetical protein
VSFLAQVYPAGRLGAAAPVTLPVEAVVLAFPSGTVFGLAVGEGPDGLVRLVRHDDPDFDRLVRRVTGRPPTPGPRGAAPSLV